MVGNDVWGKRRSQPNGYSDDKSISTGGTGVIYEKLSKLIFNVYM